MHTQDSIEKRGRKKIYKHCVIFHLKTFFTFHFFFFALLSSSIRVSSLFFLFNFLFILLMNFDIHMFHRLHSSHFKAFYSSIFGIGAYSKEKKESHQV